MDYSSINNNNMDEDLPPSYEGRDPKDSYFLRFCFVCNEEAPPDKEHYSNYGGIVCLSCRAFFRRAHQVRQFHHQPVQKRYTVLVSENSFPSLIKRSRFLEQLLEHVVEIHRRTAEVRVSNASPSVIAESLSRVVGNVNTADTNVASGPG